MAGEPKTVTEILQQTLGMGDAGYLRVSSIGLATSLTGLDITNTAANDFRTSALVDSGSISAKCTEAAQLVVSCKSLDGSTMRVSAVQPDAGLLHVSAIGLTLAFDGDAANNRVSAIGATLTLNTDAANNRISALSDDAGQCRVSALGVTAAFNADAANNRVSAIVDSGSISAKSPAADTFRVSAFIDSGSVSAKSSDAGTMLISAKTDSAAQFRVSSFIDSGSVSAKSPAADAFRTSAFIDSGSVSAKSGAADQLRVSAGIFSPLDTYGALATIDHSHSEIHEGGMFRTGEVIELDANETRVWEFITPAVSASTKRAHINLDFATTGDTQITLYEAPTVSADGTLFTPYNRNRTSTTVNVMSAYYSPNVTSFGTTILLDERFGARDFGLETRANHEWILSSAKTYALSCKSNTINNAVTFKVNWYEE